MKRVILFPTVFLCILFLTIILYYTSNLEKYNDSNSELIKLSQKQKRSEAPNTNEKKIKQTTSNTEKHKENDIRWTLRREKLKNDPKFEWRSAISFYGKVLDESRNAIPKAEITIKWNNMTAPGSHSRKIFSNDDGTFNFNGENGLGLSINIVKSGYRFNDRINQKRFEYSKFWEKNFHEPDPEKPVIFILQKKNDTAELINHYIKFDFPINQEPLIIDLKSGEISRQGDIVVKLVKKNIYRNIESRYDWEVIISIPNGGIQEHIDISNYSAPTSNYHKSLKYKFPANLEKWDSSIEKRLYIVFGSSKIYGRIRFRVKANRNRLYLDYYINPSGSQNLEYENSKDITYKYVQ